MKPQIKFTLIFFFVLSVFKINAQSHSIETNILLAPPYPTNLDAYIDYLEEGIIEVINLENSPQEVFFSVLFEETSGLISVNTNGVLGESIVMQPGVNIFTPADIETVFGGLNMDNLVINGLSQAEQNAILLNRQMPEGNYRICIEAFDELGILISDPAGSCLDFDLFFAERPYIQTPFDDEEIDTLGFLAVNWDHIVNSPQVANRLEYTLKIIDLTEEAITNVELSMLDPAVPTVYEEELGNTFFVNLTDEIDLFLNSGHLYAARVSVADPDGNVAFQFGGHSEIVIFSYGEQKASSGDLLTAPEITSPEIGDNIEVEDPALLSFEVEWEHDTDDVKGNLSYSAKMVDLTDKEIEDITLPIMLSDTTEFIWEDENFQRIILFEYEEEELELVSGNSYAIMISVESDNPEDIFENDGHSEIVSFVFGEEEEGYSMPEITSPVAESYIPKAEIPLTWTHDVSDQNLAKTLSYTLKIIDLTQEKIPRPSIAHFEDDKVNKLWNEAIVEKEKIIKPTASQKLTLYNKYAVAIFVETSDESFEMPNDGYSNIITFTHGVQPSDPDGCTGGDCESSLPQDLTAVAIKKLGLKNKIFKMGDMDMKIDEAKGSAADGYTGEGEIKIGFIANGVRIKVSFENLKVNANAEVIAGTAIAMYDDKFENIDKLVSVGASTFLDIDFNAAKELGPALRTANKLTSGLSGTDVVTLPFGYDKKEGEETSIVAITKMTFSPIKSEMMALFSLENPDWGEYVPSLGADNICFKNGGFAKQVRLYLSKDYPIGNDGEFILKKTDLNNPESLGTFVELNCKGFKKAQITAEIPIARETLIPVDETGLVIEDEASKVIITVSGTIEPKSNWIFAASASPFEIPGLDGFSVTLQNGFYDASDRTNPPNFALPDGYTPEENREHWKGVWFEEISITAPRDWGGGSEEVSTKIAMKNFIKDKAGISINGEAENILSIEKGSYEGFAISMDLLKIDILRSQFKSVSLEGRMGLPILPEDKFLKYKGVVDHGDKINAQQSITNNQNTNNNSSKTSMVFTVNVGEESFYIPSIRSNLTFDETSQIIIKNDNKEKGIEALIEGYLAIGDTDGGPDLEPDESVFRFPALKFTGMSLSTIRPINSNQAGSKNTTKKGKSKLKLTAPTFEFASLTPAPKKEDATNDTKDKTKEEEEEEEAEEPKVNGFHIGLTEVSMSFGEEGEVDETEATDGMAMNLKIGGELAIVKAASSGKTKAKKTKKGGFELSAEASVTSISRVNKKDGKFTFEFEKISSATLEVDSQMGPIGLKGSLEIYNGDEEFGKGVVGDVKIEVPMLTVDVEARFGNMTVTNDDSFNYFYLFGKLDIPTGIPIPQTPIKLHRFLGGAYSNMAMKPGAELAETAKEKYTPDSGIAFGFKAGLGFSVASPSTVFATMAFEMSITDDGGINQITLDGQLDMMQAEPFGDLSGSDFEGIRLKAAVSVLPSRAEEPGRENLKITGGFLAKANLAEGTIVGAQAGTELYQVVSGNLEIDGEGFELTLGTYSNPGVVRAKLGDDAGLDATFYLQASYGKPTNFEEAPVPEFIQRLLNQGKSGDQGDFESSGGDPTAKAANTHESTGMNMVAGFNLSVGADINYSILYAHFKAMLGFDLSLKTNKNVVCSNLGGTAMGMGADGYYAKGQVYAGLEGGVGLNVDIFGYKGKIELAYVYAAMLLNGGFANPSWVRGQASMGYSVLGGLVSGKTYFDIQIGEKCEEYYADPFAGVKFIEGIDPDASKQGVSPFVKPIVSFENRIGQYEFKNANGSMQYFDVRLEEFKIDGHYFTKQVSGDKLSAHLDVSKLKPHTNYTIRAKVRVYKWNGSSWLPATSNSTGKEVVENVTHTFRTGAMPDYVPWNNVQDMYPFRNEEYYMIAENEYDQGIVKLIGGQAELFKAFTPSGQQWHSKVVAKVWNNKTKTWIHKTDVTYYSGTNVILFKLPKSILNTSTSYAIRLTREWYLNNSYDTSTADIKDENVVAYSGNAYSNYTYKKEGKSYKNASNKKPANKTLFEYWFKTSKYRSFQKKVTAGPATTPATNKYIYLDFKINNSEPFSEQEIGYKYIAESRSLMKNTAFVKEELEYFVGAYLIDEYELIGNRFKKYHGSKFNMKVLTNHKFEKGNWRNGFDFYDVPSRKLYENKSTSQINFRSRAYNLFPTWNDLVNLDYMIYHLVEGNYEDDYEEDYKDEYYKLKKNWYDGPWRASAGGILFATDDLTEKDIDYRVGQVWKFLSHELDKEKEYQTVFLYSVPYVYSGKFYTRTSSYTSIIFKK